MRRHSEWNADPPRAGASPKKQDKEVVVTGIFDKCSFFEEKAQGVHYSA